MNQIPRKSEATVSINKQMIRIAAGAGSPARNNQIEIGAGDTWGMMIGPGGDVLPLQMS